MLLFRCDVTGFCCADAEGVESSCDGDKATATGCPDDERTRGGCCWTGASFAETKFSKETDFLALDRFSMCFLPPSWLTSADLPID